MATPPNPLPETLYALFSGPINGETTARIIQGLANASASGVKQIHLMFHSAGGFVGDGIVLYNTFKSLPIDLTIYNSGVVASIASIAYLGARVRKVTPYGAFMIHKSRCTFQGVSVNRAKAVIDSAILDDQRTEAILRERITMPAEQWAKLESDDLWLSSKDAVEYGIADEIADFIPPLGTTIRYA